MTRPNVFAPAQSSLRLCDTTIFSISSPDLVYLTKYSQYHALQFKEEFDIYNTPKDLSTIQALLLMAFRGVSRGRGQSKVADLTGLVKVY